MDFDLNGQLRGHKATAVSYGGKIHAVAADEIFGVGAEGPDEEERWQKLSLFAP